MATKTNQGLISYCKAQLGRPYWMGTFGQVATASLYNYNKNRLPQYYTASDFPSQYGQRVHDCIGLIKGYIWSDGPDAVPNYASNGCPDINEAGMLSASKEKGPISTMPELPGTLVYFSGHVGVYIGGGYVIEARGHAYGVVTTRLKDRPWTQWGKCPYISYDENNNIEEEEELTQEQFEKMYADMMSKNAKGDNPSPWAKEACEAAKAAGIFQGDGQGNYGWPNPVDRESLAVVLHRAGLLEE